LKEENDKKIARQKPKALRTLRKGVTIMRRASHYPILFLNNWKHMKNTQKLFYFIFS